LRAWFQGLLRVPSLAWTKRHLSVLDTHQHREFERVGSLIENLDTVTGKWLAEMQGEVDNIKPRLITLRELNKNVKEMVRKQDDRIRDLENEISQLTETVGKIEFPDFDKIEYTLPDSKNP